MEQETEVTTPYRRETKSLCPECLKVIDAVVLEKDGKILIEKKCAAHGEFSDVYWSDAAIFKGFLRYRSEKSPIDNPSSKSGSRGGCPLDCGLCDNHKTHTMLANIDVTNRCNQKCPICFANSATSGYLYEPSIDQVKKMLQALRNESPTPTDSVQFSGGEPTMYPRIVETVMMAKDMGFKNIMMATNGVLIAADLDFARRLKEAGLKAAYLQFDGITPGPYIAARGYDALPIKKKAVENLGKAHISTVLVPTVVKGINDDQLGGIIDYAFEHIESVKAVNFQPVSFTGRIDAEELGRRRITLPDVFKLVEKQTGGKLKVDDWLPIPAITPLEMLLDRIYNTRISKSSVHEHCGAGVYVFKKDDSYVTLSSFMDLEKAREIILKEVEGKGGIANDLKLGIADGLGMKLEVILRLSRTIDTQAAPKYFNWKTFLKSVVFKQLEDDPKTLIRNAMFIGCMHFMDPYNFDLDRVQRCCIHYSTPDGRIIPFCSYNVFHREGVERKHSVKFQKGLGN
jgi:7,8-dihydro-6-hydroxymethylpterin dimethyltransferase